MHDIEMVDEAPAPSLWDDPLGVENMRTIDQSEVDPLAVSGDIITAGSSTVFPLTERMAERFQDEGYAGNITIDSIGSGAGFERFCVAGETDISNASRPRKSDPRFAETLRIATIADQRPDAG